MPNNMADFELGKTLIDPSRIIEAEMFAHEATEREREFDYFGLMDLEDRLE